MYLTIKSVSLSKNLQFLGMGGTRKVYKSKSGKYVFKIPYNDYGVTANNKEHDYYQNNKWFGREKLARCRLFGDVLVMEYVEPALNGMSLPDWTCYIDCQQVGYNREGKLVAYDWA